MTEKERNDYFYVCALIEYIARETKNHRGDIVNAIGKSGIEKLLYDAEVNHCLSFEQVSDEVIQYYKITQDINELLFLSEDEKSAKELYEDYRFYDKNVYYYPAKDLLFFQADIHGNLLIRQRMKVIRALLEECVI